MLKYLYFLIVTLWFCNACINTTKNFESSWKVLKTAATISCKKFIPNNSKIIEKMWFLENNSLSNFPVIEGFLYQTISFSGIRNYYYLDFTKNTTININNAISKDIGIDNVIAGVGKLFNNKYILVIKKTKNNSILQLRNLDDNALKTSYKLKNSNIIWAKTLFVKNGIWLLYKNKNKHNLNEANENLNIQILFIHVSSDLKLKIINYDINLIDNIKAINIYDNNIIIIGYNLDKSTKNTFNYLYLNSTNTTIKKQQLNIKLNEAVESWDIQKFGSYLFITYVEGDSLIGMSNLNVGLLKIVDKDINVQWIKSKSLLNEHVANPKLLIKHNKFIIAIPKWIDMESVLGIYDGDISGISSSKAVGIFKYNTYILTFFSHINLQDLYILLRIKQEEQFTYNLCKLPL